MLCNIEIFLDNEWQLAAHFEPDSAANKAGYRSAGYLNYDVQYVAQQLHSGISSALSCNFPTSFELWHTNKWPAFLLDILPSGAGRRYWLNQLGLSDGASADWLLLLQGAGNPIGNLRIQQAVQPLSDIQHPGFSHNEIIQRRDDFIEYAFQHGAPVSGSSGAQGDAPKFLLTQDKQGRWHADGALADDKCAKHWLVKFPKSNRDSDIRVLLNEAAYYEVARECGLYTGEEIKLENNILFIPRFDRQVTSGNQVIRLGIESLSSLAGITEFGAATSKNEYCKAIARHCTNPTKDLIEFVKRDVLDIALGNTDNHGRNTAIQRLANNNVRLTPLYDFAPMILDSQGIARLSRWENEEYGGKPAWSEVLYFISTLGVNLPQAQKALLKLRHKIAGLPSMMKKHGVDEKLITQLQPRIQNVEKELARIN